MKNDVQDMTLDMYRIHDLAMPIRPGNLGRQWMDQTAHRFAYRCTPLNIANTSGWTAHCPIGFSAKWDGRPTKDAIKIETQNNAVGVARYVSSHFGHGILTFHLGWLLKTSRDWAIWARGCPNMFKPGVSALDGIVETEWLNFPFTMNWRFHQPGEVIFFPNDPICFFNIFPHAMIDRVQPIMHVASKHEDIYSEFKNWRDSRNAFNASLEHREPGQRGTRWQKKYLHAEPAKSTHSFHSVKRRLQEPRWAAEFDPPRKTES